MEEWKWKEKEGEGEREEGKLKKSLGVWPQKRSTTAASRRSQTILGSVPGSLVNFQCLQLKVCCQLLVQRCHSRYFSSQPFPTFFTVLPKTPGLTHTCVSNCPVFAIFGRAKRQTELRQTLQISVILWSRKMLEHAVLCQLIHISGALLNVNDRSEILLK